MPQDPVWIWAQCRWNGLGKDTGFTRSSLCAPNETDFSNNISKAGESEAAMHTFSNYCCGPVIALPKSCFNNMKGWTAHAYREESKTIIKSIGFLSKKSVNTMGKELTGIKTDLVSTQKHKSVVKPWSTGRALWIWYIVLATEKGKKAVFCLPWSEILPLTPNSKHTLLLSRTVNAEFVQMSHAVAQPLQLQNL